MWANTMTEAEWEALDRKMKDEIEYIIMYIQNEDVDCIDSLSCKRCVECIGCRDCEDCSKCEGCRKCHDCKNCIACEYLENAENMICNMPLEEWKKLTKKEKVKVLEEMGVDAELRDIALSSAVEKCLRMK